MSVPTLDIIEQTAKLLGYTLHKETEGFSFVRSPDGESVAWQWSTPDKIPLTLGSPEVARHLLKVYNIYL